MHHTDTNAAEHEHPGAAFCVRRVRGYWRIEIFGWGIRYKNSQIFLPSFAEGIGEIRNLKFGIHWFRVLTPGSHHPE